MTTDEQTFKVDNFFIQAAPGLIGAKPVQLSLPYPGQEPFSKFDFWVAMGCYSLVNPKNPKEPVVVSLTQFVEILDFAKTVARSSDGYSRMTYTSDAYAQVKESLHRLFSVEVNLRGEYLVRVKTKGKRQRRPVEYHGRLLASYMYIYPADVIPPDQLPEAKRRNINEAKTRKGEPGPPVWERVDGVKPDAIQFRIADEMLRGLTGEDPNIGSTIFPVRVFKLRRELPSRDKTTPTVLAWVIRQTSRKPKIALDKLVKWVGFAGRNVERNRQRVLDSLKTLQSAGVVESFSHNAKTDVLTIIKADDWVFGAAEDDVEA